VTASRPAIHRQNPSFLDRYAYDWMWWHGGWNVLVAGEPPLRRPPASANPVAGTHATVDARHDRRKSGEGIG
jgi:hypothetical protein